MEHLRLASSFVVNIDDNAVLSNSKPTFHKVMSVLIVTLAKNNAYAIPWETRQAHSPGSVIQVYPGAGNTKLCLRHTISIDLDDS